MCGIAGTFGLDLRREPGLLQRMAACLRHRGPDGHGTWTRSHDASGLTVGLAHTRLAILDRSAAGAQPMQLDGGRLVLSHNGEIFNHQALRDELRALGRRFEGGSDSEVILHAVDAWGLDEALARLRGAFSFALWDEQDATLYLVRDRLGLKPIVYCAQDGALVFASEAKALREWSGCPREIDAAAVADYLALLYIPAPRTILRGVQKLMPGHYAIARRGTFALRRWWDPRPQVVARSEEDVASELRALIEDAVGEQLMGDVPIGAFVSGGLDSSAVVASMRARGVGRPRTFAIGHTARDAGWSESRSASKVAARLGCMHQTIVVGEPSLEMLGVIARGFDEPFGNPTAVLTHRLALSARPHVTVALTGDGGDELFLGYARYRAVRLVEAMDGLPALPRELWRAVSAMTARIGPRAAHLTRFTRGLGRPLVERYMAWQTWLGADLHPRLFTDRALEQLGGYDPCGAMRFHAERANCARDIDTVSYLDLNTYLPSNLLDCADRMGMSSSIELRAPLLDHRIVELALSVPADQKLPWLGPTKHVLRRALRGLVPDEVILRPKRGFNPPIGSWMSRLLDALRAGLLAEQRVRDVGWVRPEFVARLADEHRRGAQDRGNVLWALAVLHAWFEGRDVAER